MTSVAQPRTLHPGSTCNPGTALCPSVNDRVASLAVCSLPAVPHHSHHMLICEETGAVIGEWTYANAAFLEPLSRSPLFSHVA